MRVSARLHFSSTSWRVMHFSNNWLEMLTAWRVGWLEFRRLRAVTLGSRLRRRKQWALRRVKLEFVNTTFYSYPENLRHKQNHLLFANSHSHLLLDSHTSSYFLLVDLYNFQIVTVTRKGFLLVFGSVRRLNWNHKKHFILLLCTDVSCFVQLT